MTERISFDTLFDPDFLSRLQGFSLRLAQVQKGGRLAEQKTTARGQGLEFADFKPYVAGDDLRAIDWNIYQRLGRLFVRVFEEKQDLPVYFLIDVSNSMFAETPARINTALKTVLALSSIVLGQHDSVGLFPFSEQLQTQIKAISGRNNLIRIAQMLCDYTPQGQTALATALHHLSNFKLRQGLVVVVSDFFEDQGLDPVMDALKNVRHQLLLVQLTRKQDADPRLDPQLEGDLLIEDSENAKRTELTITDDLLRHYLEAYQRFEQQLTDFTNDYGATRIRIDSDQDVLEQLSGLFKAGGLIL